MTDRPAPKARYKILRDGVVAHDFVGAAEAVLAHLRSLQRRFPQAFWDLERVRG